MDLYRVYYRVLQDFKRSKEFIGYNSNKMMYIFHIYPRQENQLIFKRTKDIQ